MSTTLTLTFSSIKMFLRNRQALFFTFFTPLIIMTILGFIGFERTPKINVGLVTENPSPATEAFINQVKAIPAFNVSTGSAEDEARAIEQGERAIILAVPPDFVPRETADTRPRTLTVFINSGQADQAQTALPIVRQILNTIALRLSDAPMPFMVEAREINVFNLRYIDFLLPGIVALAVMQMSVFSVAFVFADYREKGILKRLLATPVRPYQFIGANVATRLIIALLQTAILIGVGIFLFNTRVVGSYALVFVTAFLGAIMFLGLGFTISGLAKTVESVPALANLVVFPMLFLGGTFFPLSSMPDWLQNIARYLPLTYFSHALREIMTRNASLFEIRTDMLWMAAWSVLLIVLSNLTFSFSEKRL